MVKSNGTIFSNSDNILTSNVTCEKEKEMKWNVGDHGVVWREKYLPDSIAHLLGQEVIVVDVPRKSAGTIQYIPMYGDIVIVNSGKRDHHLTVRKYNSEDEDFYRIDTRCMSKTTRKIEKGSWNECPWVPNELKE